MSGFNGYMKRKLWREGKTSCARCGEPIPRKADATLEHLVARCLGGTDDESNLALSHLECNRAHARIEMLEARRRRKSYAALPGEKP